MTRETYRVGCLHASIHDIGAHAFAGAAVVGVGRGAGAGVREAGETPGSASLGIDSVVLGILLNVGDLCDG